MKIEALEIEKGYPEGEERWLHVIKGLSMSVEEGEFAAVTGESGVGKSTLLHVLGLLDRPDAGEVLLDGKRTADLPDGKLASLRNRSIGFVFQFHHLMPEFDARENVAMPMLLAGESAGVARKRAMELLSRVGLAERADHFPNALSGGEQQRVALARALVNSPELLLADEPTGNLDEANEDRLAELLFEMTREAGLTVILATHNRDLASRAGRIYRLENGVAALATEE